MNGRDLCDRHTETHQCYLILREENGAKSHWIQTNIEIEVWNETYRGNELIESSSYWFIGKVATTMHQPALILFTPLDTLLGLVELQR